MIWTATYETKNKVNIIAVNGRPMWKKSIIITTDLPVAKWYAYINYLTLANDILNRMTTIAIRERKRESLRIKKSIKENSTLYYKSNQALFTYWLKDAQVQHAGLVG